MLSLCPRYELSRRQISDGTLIHIVHERGPQALHNGVQNANCCAKLLCKMVSCMTVRLHSSGLCVIEYRIDHT